MDSIIIANLEVFYHVGVPDAERAQPQRLLLNIEIADFFLLDSLPVDIRHNAKIFREQLALWAAQQLRLR